LSPDTSLREAWEKIPSPGEVGSEAERFAGRRMERIIAIVVAVGALALGVQALLSALASIERFDTPHLALLSLAFVPWAAMLVACVIGRGVRIAAGAFTVGYLIVLVFWPFVAFPGDLPHTQPWIFFLVNVAGAAAVVAFPIGVQVLWALLGPFLYGFVRLAQGGFAPEFGETVAFDVSFTLILGSVIVALAWMFRSVATGVDDARGRAVSSYAAAAAAAASEEERVAVAALMHDSVLAALIAAERARTDRERDLAVAMAREALTRLANAEASTAQEGSEEPVEIVRIAEDLERSVRELDVEAQLDCFGHGSVPDRVARAVALAARQAIGNAVAHAGGRGLTIVVEGHGETGITVKVSDAGPGFDLGAVAPDRLGIRASILARMTAVGGTAVVESDRRGTSVTLGWSER